MIDENEISETYLSQEFLDSYDVTSAFVAKAGFIPSTINENSTEAFFGDDNAAFSDKVTEYINEIYALADKSPHVMDVEPSLEDYVKLYDEGDVGISVWPFQSTITIDFIKFRMVMPKRTREQLGVFKRSWSPEEFNIAFNGSLFLTYAPIQSIPVFTDLGQIAREYLKGFLDDSTIIESFDGIGPTPIHPEIYFIKAKIKNHDTEVDYKLPKIDYIDDDIVIIIPDEDDLEVIIQPLLHDLEYYIGDFYSERLMDRKLSDLIDELEELNETLGIKLSEHFKLSLIKRLFSNNPKEIRELLASMHLALQEISSAQFHVKKKREEAIKGIDDSTFLKGASGYFSDHMKDDTNFDRDSQLTSMNFAAEETSNFVITQATLIAALIGAIIGGTISSITQFLAGSGGT